MNINVIALFPEVIKSSLVGVTGKAFENGKAKLNLVDLKDFPANSYGSVDDSPYGGGEGMVCLLYTSPSPRDQRGSRMPSSA